MIKHAIMKYFPRLVFYGEMVRVSPPLGLGIDCPRMYDRVWQAFRGLADMVRRVRLMCDPIIKMLVKMRKDSITEL